MRERQKEVQKVHFPVFSMKHLFVGEQVQDFRDYFNQKRKKYKYIIGFLTKINTFSSLTVAKMISLYRKTISLRNTVNNT